jgi:hypothetical protein
MSKKNCKIDIVSVQIKQKQDVKKMSFEQILCDNEILGQEKIIGNKSVNFTIIDNNEEYVIGFIRATLDKDLPAKIDKKTKEISKLDVKVTEGLAYGNVFLYSKKLNVIFYEVNKNSIYLNNFKQYIYKCYNSSTNLKDNTSFDISFGTIYRKNEYERALDMNFYKNFTLKVHQPGMLLDKIRNANKSLEKKIQNEVEDNDFEKELERASKLNSQIAEISYEVKKSKKSSGLNKEVIRKILKKFHNLIGSSEISQHIDKIEISGYSTSELDKLNPINILGDIYYSKFELEVPRLDSNLQKTDRSKAILEVYKNEYNILNEYI